MYSLTSSSLALLLFPHRWLTHLILGQVLFNSSENSNPDLNIFGKNTNEQKNNFIGDDVFLHLKIFLFSGASFKTTPKNNLKRKVGRDQIPFFDSNIFSFGEVSFAVFQTDRNCHLVSFSFCWVELEVDQRIVYLLARRGLGNQIHLVLIESQFPDFSQSLEVPEDLWFLFVWIFLRVEHA